MELGKLNKKVPEDLKLAQQYSSKYSNAFSRGLEFTLSFNDYKRLVKRKRCAYTGISMTRARSGKNTRETDLTLERIDNHKGYTPDNVIAVCHAANKLKSLWENSNSIISQKFVTKLVTNKFLK